MEPEQPVPPGDEPPVSVQALTAVELQRRVGDSFPAVYLTIISIIQGVALGLLATNTSAAYYGLPTGSPIVVGLALFARSLLLLLTVVLISYQYTWFVGVFRWPPRFWDTLVPFALGSAEIVPMFVLQNEIAWWWWMWWLCVMGGLAFLNSWRHCRRDLFPDSEQAYARSKRILRENGLVCAAISMVCVAAAGATAVAIGSVSVQFAFLIVFLGGAIWMIVRTESYMGRLYADFGLRRL